jgi:hypothetical protein
MSVKTVETALLFANADIELLVASETARAEVKTGKVAARRPTPEKSLIVPRTSRQVKGRATD